MFLVNSSVGSFAAAPTSLDTKVVAFKRTYSCYLSQKKSIWFIKGFFENNLWLKANLRFTFLTMKNSVLMRCRYTSRLTLFPLLLLSERGSYPPKWGRTLSRSYGRCIAEFLSEGSLVSLSLLDSSTCVGLRYGRLYSRVHLLFLPVPFPKSPP